MKYKNCLWKHIFQSKRFLAEIAISSENFWYITSIKGNKNSFWFSIGPVEQDDLKAYSLMIGPVAITFAKI